MEKGLYSSCSDRLKDHYHLLLYPILFVMSLLLIKNKVQVLVGRNVSVPDVFLKFRVPCPFDVFFLFHEYHISVPVL